MEMARNDFDERQVNQAGRGKALPRCLLAAALAGLGVLVLRKVRPWYLRWGATDAEVARHMPLDERVPAPRLCSTMAITLEAPPAEVWPWLAQMGDPPRAGYYSYTWIERLVGMQIENAGVILPHVQPLHVGDALDRNGTMVVQAVEPDRYLVLGPPDSIATVRCTWAFVLKPIAGDATRLVTRVRAAWKARRLLKEMSPLTWPLWLLLEPGAFIMQRKMLREIKQLVEAAHGIP
jgi:hypothetical protein